MSCHGEMGEGASRSTRMEPHSGKRRPVWTASSPKTGPKWVCRGLVDLSTISNRSTGIATSFLRERLFLFDLDKECSTDKSFFIAQKESNQ
jgi:hypothetical protein